MLRCIAHHRHLFTESPHIHYVCLCVENSPRHGDAHSIFASRHETFIFCTFTFLNEVYREVGDRLCRSIIQLCHPQPFSRSKIRRQILETGATFQFLTYFFVSFLNLLYCNETMCMCECFVVRNAVSCVLCTMSCKTSFSEIVSNSSFYVCLL